MPSEHRRSFRILFFCLVCIGLGQSMLFAILPPAARELDLSPFRVSLIFVPSAAIWVLMSPRWGRRSDLIGRRPIILIGLLGFGSSMFLLATMIALGLAGLLPIAVAYPLMIASRCVFGLFGSGTGPASQAYIADRTDRLERAAGVALVTAALGTGQTLGPGVGALLSVFGLLAPIYFSALLAVASAVAILALLPEPGPPVEPGAPPPPRMSFRDRRVRPFLLVSTALQAVRATTAITLAFFLQDQLGLDAQRTVQLAGVGFVTLAVAGLFSQLVLVQRLRPSPRSMIWTGIPLMLAAFVLFCTGTGFSFYLAALALLGMGLGLARPGNAAGASLSVGADEQGAVAGLLGAIGVLGNVFGPMLGTTLYEITPRGPYLLNAAIMAIVLVAVFSSRRFRA